MKTSDIFPSRFLGHDDLDGDVSVTITKVWLEEMEAKGRPGKVKKPVVQFAEFDKPMVLNKTNWLAISARHGDESDGWAGKGVVLGVRRVQSFGEAVDAIRVAADGARPGVAAPPAVNFGGDWRQVEIHFGKNKGRKLGDLNGAALDWYRNEWKPKAHAHHGTFSGTDLQLRAALDKSLSEVARQPEIPLPSDGQDDDVPF